MVGASLKAWGRREERKESKVFKGHRQAFTIGIKRGVMGV